MKSWSLTKRTYSNNMVPMSRPALNPTRYKKVLKLRNSPKQKTFQQIADQLGISRQRAYQIYTRAIKKQKLLLHG